MSFTTPPERITQVPSTLHGETLRTIQVPPNNRTVVVPNDE